MQPPCTRQSSHPSNVSGRSVNGKINLLAEVALADAQTERRQPPSSAHRQEPQLLGWRPPERKPTSPQAASRWEHGDRPKEQKTYRFGERNPEILRIHEVANQSTNGPPRQPDILRNHPLADLFSGQSRRERTVWQWEEEARRIIHPPSAPPALKRVHPTPSGPEPQVLSTSMNPRHASQRMSFSAQPSVSSVANTWSNVPRPAISPPEHASRPPLVSPTEYGLRTPISGAIPSQSHAWRRSSEVGQALKAKGASARKDGTQTRTSLTSPLSMIGRADVFASEGGVTCEISGLLQKEDAGKHECDLLSGPCESQAGSASEHSTDESTPSPFDRHGNTRVTSSNPRALNGHQQVDGGTGYHRDALSLAKANLPSRAFILKRPPSPTAISDDDFSSCKRRRVHSEGDAETIRADEARPRTYARRRDGPRRRTQNADAQMRYRGKKKWVAQQMEKELAEMKSKLEMSEVVNTRLKVELEALRLRSSRGKESNPTRRDEIDLNKR